MWYFNAQYFFLWYLNRQHRPLNWIKISWSRSLRWYMRGIESFFSCTRKWMGPPIIYGEMLHEWKQGRRISASSLELLAAAISKYPDPLIFFCLLLLFFVFFVCFGFWSQRLPVLKLLPVKFRMCVAVNTPCARALKRRRHSYHRLLRYQQREQCGPKKVREW